MSVGWQFALSSAGSFFGSQLGSHALGANYWSAWRTHLLAIFQLVQCGQLNELYLILQQANSSLFPWQLGSKTSQTLEVCWGLFSKLSHCHVCHILLAKQVTRPAQIQEMGISSWGKELQNHSMAWMWKSWELQLSFSFLKSTKSVSLFFLNFFFIFN